MRHDENGYVKLLALLMVIILLVAIILWLWFWVVDEGAEYSMTECLDPNSRNYIEISETSPTNVVFWFYDHVGGDVRNLYTGKTNIVYNLDQFQTDQRISKHQHWCGMTQAEVNGWI